MLSSSVPVQSQVSYSTPENFGLEPSSVLMSGHQQVETSLLSVLYKMLKTHSFLCASLSTPCRSSTLISGLCHHNSTLVLSPLVNAPHYCQHDLFLSSTCTLKSQCHSRSCLLSSSVSASSTSALTLLTHGTAHTISPHAS